MTEVSQGRPEVCRPQAAELALLDEAWVERYSDPDAVTRVVAELPSSSFRAVLETFLAWREGRPGEALAIASGLVTPGVLPVRWRMRARGVQAVVLGEVGLEAEAIEALVDQLGDARAEGDLVALASATHDLGVTCESSEPGRAMSQYAETLRILDEVDPEDAAAADVPSLRALAITNMHSVATTFAVPLPEGAPSLVEAEEVCRESWPEMSAAIHAVQALYHASDEQDMQQLVATLPDPAGMTDLNCASYVARARALVQARDGDPAGAVAQLDRLIDRLPPKFVPEVLETLVVLHRESGDLAAALEASERRAELLVQRYTAESRTAIRALEVWFRTRQAEERALELQRHVEELDRDRQMLRDHSRRDPLTGLWNRQHLLDTVEMLPLTPLHQVALVDVDRFKSINDTAGHAVGDDALRALAARLREATGLADTCVRYGGDEIVVLRPDGVPGLLAEDLAAVASFPRREGLGLPAMTVSIGVSWVGSSTFAQALARADELMYAAKRAGGGQVVADPPPPELTA